MKETTNFQDNYFEFLGNTPKLWFWKANDLLKAADTLRKNCPIFKVKREDIRSIFSKRPRVDRFRHFGVMMMLRAMAIECILKGLWTKAGGKLTKGGKFMRIPNTGDHDLVSLANAIGKKMTLKFSSKEKQFLERLSVAIVEERYPIPTKASKQQIWGWGYPVDDDNFEAIMLKLRPLTK